MGNYVEYEPQDEGMGEERAMDDMIEYEPQKRRLMFKRDGQEYAQVVKMLESHCLEADCFDGVKRLCLIEIKPEKRILINQGDIVLIRLREDEDAKAEIVLKYSTDEAQKLKLQGELLEFVQINENIFAGGLEDEMNEFELKESQLAILHGIDEEEVIDPVIEKGDLFQTQLRSCKIIY